MDISNRAIPDQTRGLQQALNFILSRPPTKIQFFFFFFFLSFREWQCVCGDDGGAILEAKSLISWG